jgi:sensor c-di-GMP phosphodiesterase-like protein
MTMQDQQSGTERREKPGWKFSRWKLSPGARRQLRRFVIFLLAFSLGLGAPLLAGQPMALLGFGALMGLLLALSAMLALDTPQPLSVQLRRAVEEGGLRLVYQPIVTLDANHKIIGLEPLLRWMSEVEDPIDPELFLPLAEALGLSRAINHKVIDWMLEDLAPILTVERDDAFCVTLNIAGADFNDVNERRRLIDAVERARVPPHCIAIELDEISASDRQARAAIWDMKQRGYRLSIDRFGSGAGDIEYLTSLSPDLVKIDRRCVAMSVAGGPLSGVVTDLVHLAKKSAAKIVLIGIESPDMAKRAANAGADFAQGLFWHKPLPAAEVVELVQG